MDKTKTVKTRKTPTPAFAVISFLVIVAVLVALINLGVDTTMSVFIAALIAVVIALLLDIPWADVERTLLRVVSDCIPTFLIVIMVGMLVGIWMAFALDENLRAVIFVIRWKRGGWRRIKTV